MRKIRIGLLAKILIAIALGIVIGLVTPGFLVRICLTFNYIFSQFLGFAVPLIILGFIISAISGVGRSASKMLFLTVLIAYGSTVFAGIVSYLTGAALFPSMITSNAPAEITSTVTKLTPYFTLDIPPLMNVMSALILAFVLGLGIATSEKSLLRGIADEFKDIIEKIITVIIIPLLPIYIFGIFLNMTYEGEVASVISVFIKIILVIFAIHILILVIQFAIAGIFTKKNPFKLLYNMLPAYFTALGTQSSVATIPVTLKQSVKNGVSESVAGFTVPLCATIHMSGSTLKIVACALAIMIMKGMPYDFSLYLGFIALLGITMVAAPGVPGGAIMAALGVLEAIFGFDPETQALMIALYIAMDSFGTACNVTGDGAIALIINKISHKKV